MFRAQKASERWRGGFGGHPMAGKENSGIAWGRELFEGRFCLLRCLGRRSPALRRVFAD